MIRFSPDKIVAEEAPHEWIFVVRVARDDTCVKVVA
jgi:hypothetical protein